MTLDNLLAPRRAQVTGEVVEASELKEKFRNVYGVDCSDVYRAPGRVNLIGEHMDYNLGFVMPAAIDLVRADVVSQFQERVTARYEKTTGLKPEIHICSAAQGVEEVVGK